PELLRILVRMLRFARQMTPGICRYFATRTNPAPVIAAFDKLLGSRAYLNHWQSWWLQSAIASSPAFGTGDGATRRMKWVRAALDAHEQAQTPRAYAALTLARHRQITSDELLRLYDRTGNTARPLLVAAIALTKPTDRIKKAVTQDNP